VAERPRDRARAGASGLDGEPGSEPPWRAERVSGGLGRSGGVGARRAPEAVQACAASRVVSRGGDETRSQVGAAANCWVAEAAASPRFHLVCVPRDDLSHAVRPSAGRAETRAAHPLAPQSRERHRRTKPADRRGQIPQAVSIRKRPADVEDRAVPGHWEGDLITGPRHALHLATLVERTTRFVVLVKVNSKDAQHVARRLQRKIRQLPSDPTKTLTWERGAGDGGPRAVHHREGDAGLLLRSPKPVATRHQRKHQRPAAPVLPEIDGSFAIHSTTTGPRRTRTQRPPLPYA